MIAHHSPVGTVQRSLYDQLRLHWVQRFQSISLGAKRQSRPDSEVEIATSTEGNLLQMGWALHKSRSGQTHFSDNVREYLQKKFDIGEETGRKEDPAQIASDIRKVAIQMAHESLAEPNGFRRFKFRHSSREFLLGESNQVRKNPREITMTMDWTTVMLKSMHVK